MDKNTMLNISSLALDEAKKLGADDCAVYMHNTLADEVTVERGHCDLMRTYERMMVDVAVFSDGRTASAVCSEASEEAVISAVHEAFEAAKNAPQTGASLYGILHRKEFLYGPDEGDTDTLLRAANKFFFDLRADGYSPDIMASLCTDFKCNQKTFMSMSGAQYFEGRNFYSMTMRLCASSGKKSTNANTFRRSFYDLNEDFMEMPLIAPALEMLPLQLDMKPAGRKFEGSVVFSPGVTDYFLSHLPACMNRKGGRLDGKLGESFFAPEISVTAMPAGGVLPGGYAFTLEGREAFDTVLVRKGVYESKLPSRRKALKPFGSSGTDEGYIMAGGEKSVAELISSVDDGLYVGRLAASYPSGDGDITGIAKQAYLIKNGQIHSAVGGTYINFNLLDVLSGTTRVSSEVIDMGHAALPFLKADGILISG